MTPWIRRALIALGALAALAAAAIAVFAITFDANQYKSLAVDWMRTERQRELAIDGPLDLSVFPRLALRVSKVRLSERARNEEFAAIDQASLSLQWLPLLRRQIVVDRVDARGVRARLLRDAQGRSNIDDLLGPPKTERSSSGGAQAMRFEVGELRLDDARLTLRDERSGVAGIATLDKFHSGRLADGHETPIEFQTTLALEQPQTLRLTFDGSAALTFDSRSGHAALRAATVKIGGDTEALKSLHATLSGSLQWDGATLTAAPLDLRLSEAQAAGVSLGTSSLIAQRLVYSPTGQRLELGALALALRGEQNAQPFELTMEWPQLAVDQQRLEGSGFSGRVKVQGKTALAGRFESGAPTGDFQTMRLPGFALRLEGGSGPRRVEGQARSNLLLRPARGAVAFERIELKAQLVDGGAAPLPLALSGQAGADARGAQWTLQGALGSNRFDSNGTASFAGAVPTLQATARFDRLDLNQLATSSASAAASAATPAAPAETPLPLEGLQSVNGRFSVSAGQLQWRQYEVDDARLEATLEGGVLRVPRLTGRAWGGSIDGSGSADAKTRRMAVKLVGQGIDAHKLLKDISGKDLLEGRGRVSIDVATSGATLGALRSNLAGAAALQLQDGAIKGVNLARTLRQARAAMSMRQDAVTRASATEKTDFSELSASARIENGVARSDDLVLTSPFVRVGGSGRVDIGAGRIDYTARATVAPAAAGPEAAELAVLRGVTVPVQLSGPLEAIDWKVQWSAVAASVVETRLKDKLADKLGLGAEAPPGSASASGEGRAAPRLEDRLKDKLRGLVGGAAGK